MNLPSLEAKRHSLAHLLAMAALRHDPAAKLAIGPDIADGFYYDILFSPGKAPTPIDLPRFEETIRELIQKKLDFTRTEVSAATALEHFKDNPFKCELINELSEKGETISLYTTGDFVDLCRGGHVDGTSELDPQAFAITRIAGAYWRGDEKNPMLTRIYGVAFDTKTELDTYNTRLEEAKKRDHRKLGRELDLFTISELVGSGLPLFTPKGSILRETLATYSQTLQAKYGFQRVWTPHMARTELYKFSGHFDKYPERFEVTSAESRDTFMLKPMNCPHHAQLFARKSWSYRDLPIRYMENTTNYRDEKHGELHGLSRVRSLSQDDGHVFCEEKDIKAEIVSIVRMVKELYASLGMDFTAHLSYRDESDKYLGKPETWQRAEKVLAEVAQEEGLSTHVDRGEAAFYGPKIDFLVRDSLDREWQCATVQLDFVQPERFGLSFITPDGSEGRPVMIHKALLGSIERFLSVYIEHTAGAFPLWLSPIQVKVIPVGEKHHSYGQQILAALHGADIRAELDANDESLGKRIREAKLEKVPYFAVVGDKEIETHTLSVDSRSEKLGALPLATFLARLAEEIKNKH